MTITDTRNQKNLEAPQRDPYDPFYRILIIIWGILFIRFGHKTHFPFTGLIGVFLIIIGIFQFLNSINNIKK